jgi:hypothetical protein
VGLVCDGAAVDDPGLLHTCLEQALHELLEPTTTAATATEELGA